VDAVRPSVFCCRWSTHTQRQRFHHAVWEVVQKLRLDQDVSVSVFETNIRVVGGLLSAHTLMVMDMAAASSARQAGRYNEFLNSYPSFLCDAPPKVHAETLRRQRPTFGSAGASVNEEVPMGWTVPYANQLLLLADELGRRLLPAFDTPTGIPFGSVNLRHGVKDDESPITCTACATTFLLEFGLLSELTGDPVFSRAARRATEAVAGRRSELGLVGGHIHVETGGWTHVDSGVGSYFDSFVAQACRDGHSETF